VRVSLGFLDESLIRVLTIMSMNNGVFAGAGLPKLGLAAVLGSWESCRSMDEHDAVCIADERSYHSLVFY
jgi:hypothetical protein